MLLKYNFILVNMNDIIIIGFGISTICFILYLIDNNL